MAILSLEGLFNAGNIQQGLLAMSNRLGDVGRRLRGVESTADRARQALRGMNAEQLSASRVQGFGQGGFSSVENADRFGITGFGRGKGPGQFSTFEEPQRILDDYRRSLERVTQATGKQEEAGKKLTKENRRQGVSFTQLLGLMIKFGIAMEIINLPGRVIGAFTSIVRGGAEAEAALAGVNALLRVSRDDIMDLGRVTRDLAADLGVTGDVFAALEEAASSIGGFPVSRVRRMQNGISLVNTELQTTVDMFELAARAAVAGGAQIEEAMRAVTTITSGFNVSVQDAGRFMDVMFKVVDKGNVTFAQLSRSFGELTGGINLLFAETDDNRKFMEFRDVLTGIAVATRTLQPAEAFTAVRNLLRGFADSSQEGLKLRNVLKQLGVNLTINDIAAQGFGATIEELSRTIGPSGRIIDQLVDKNKDLVDIMGEANFRQAQSLKIIQTLFPNIRSIRGLQAIWNNDLKLYRELSKDIAQSEGELNKQLEIRRETLSNTMATFKQFILLVKEELFFNIGVPIANVLRLVNTFLREITRSETFRNASFIDKLSQLWEAFIIAFDKWWVGGGKNKVFDISSTIGNTLGAAISAILLNADNQARMIAVGKELGFGIAKGILIGTAIGLKDFLKPTSTEQREKIRTQRTAQIETLPNVNNRFDLILHDIRQGLDVLTFRQLANPDFPDRKVLGFDRSGTNISIGTLRVGGSAEEIGEAILDLSRSMDDGSIIATRDDRINNDE